jgi:hypothetical protein
MTTIADICKKKKNIISVLIVTVAILSYSMLLDNALDYIPGTMNINQECSRYLNNWTAKSLTTLAVAKTINASLSVIQDSKMSVTLFGTGASIALGEVVRPLNEVVGNIASIALASATSLGIQRLLLEIGSWLGLKVFLTLSMICLLLAIWCGHIIKIDFRQLAYKLLALAIVAKFLIPVTVLATGYIGEQFLESKYTNAEKQLVELKAIAKSTNELSTQDSSPENNGIIDKAANFVKSIKDKFTMMVKILADSTRAYSEVAVTYIIVFIAQTMIIPVGVLWCLIKLLGYIFDPTAMSKIENRLLPPFKVSNKQKEEDTVSPIATAIIPDSSENS